MKDVLLCFDENIACQKSKQAAFHPGPVLPLSGEGSPLKFIMELKNFLKSNLCDSCLVAEQLKQKLSAKVEAAFGSVKLMLPLSFLFSIVKTFLMLLLFFKKCDHSVISLSCLGLACFHVVVFFKYFSQTYF